MHNRGSTQMQMVQLTPIVKKLIITNVSIWLIGQIILEQYFLDNQPILRNFGLVPSLVIEKFYLWQPLTYMFLHSLSITHVIFNMLMLWWFGAELETRWGSRAFLKYYLFCGLGAGLIYTFFIALYSVLTGAVATLVTPVVGASGAIFGLLLAFGILFGERVILFFFVFPMKVRYFVMIIAAIEVVSLLNNGSQSGVANLAHLGGLVSGYIYLILWAKNQQKGKKTTNKDRRGLRLVVNNAETEKKSAADEGPKYWN